MLLDRDEFILGLNNNTTKTGKEQKKNFSQSLDKSVII